MAELALGEERESAVGQAKTFPLFSRYADRMSSSSGHFLPFNFLLLCVVISRSVSHYCINVFTSIFSYIF